MGRQQGWSGTVPYAYGSDYSGIPLSLSNFFVIRKRLSRCRGIYYSEGGNYFDIWYRPGELTKKTAGKVQDILKELEDYPCLDEEDTSRREYELCLKTVKDPWCPAYGLFREHKIPFVYKFISSFADRVQGYFNFSSPYSLDYNDEEMTTVFMEWLGEIDPEELSV